MAGSISPFPLVAPEIGTTRCAPCSTCSGRGTTRSRSTGSSDRRPTPRCAVPAGQASVRRRHRRPPHLVGVDRHGQAGQPGRRGTRGSGGVPVPQPLRRPEQGPADRRHLRTRDRSRGPRVPAGPGDRHPVGRGGRDRRPRHLAGPGQRDAGVLSTSTQEPGRRTVGPAPACFTAGARPVRNRPARGRVVGAGRSPRRRPAA